MKIASRWVNVGVAPKTKPAYLAWSLLNGDGMVAWCVTDEAFDFRALAPRLQGVEKPVDVTSTCRMGFVKRIPEPDCCVVWARASGRKFGDTINMLKPGTYTLAVSVGTAQGTPQIALPLAGGTARRYPLGTVTVTEAADSGK